MARQWRILFVAIESIIMALAYGMAMMSYFWELYRAAIILLAAGVIMNIAIITRTRRWEVPEKTESD